MKFITNKGNTIIFSSFSNFVEKFSTKLQADNFLLDGDIISILNETNTNIFCNYEQIEKIEHSYYNSYFEKQAKKIALLYKKLDKPHKKIGNKIIKNGLVYLLGGSEQKDCILSSNGESIIDTTSQFEKSNGEVVKIYEYLVFDGENFIIAENKENIISMRKAKDIPFGFNRRVNGTIKVPFNYKFNLNYKLVQNGDDHTVNLNDGDIEVTKEFYYQLKKELIIEKLKNTMKASINQRNFLLSHGKYAFVFNQKLSGHKSWDTFFKKRAIRKRLSTQVEISAKSLLILNTFYEGNHYGYRLNISIKDNILTIISQGRDKDNDREWDNENINILNIRNGKVSCKEVISLI